LCKIETSFSTFNSKIL
jgi:hypothetical protein